MSVTFYIPKGNRTAQERPCIYCGAEPNPERGFVDDPKCGHCYDQGGDVEWQERYSLNVANGNASAILYALDLPDDYCGEVAPEDLLARIERVSAYDRSTMERLPEQIGRVIDCGRGADQIERYFTRLRRIADEAIRRGDGVHWS